MALTITVFDANNDGTGIDLAAYLADSSTRPPWRQASGYFSSSATDFSGQSVRQHRSRRTCFPTRPNKRGLRVFGGGGKSIDYTLRNSHRRR